jgi:hypothetical protein
MKSQNLPIPTPALPLKRREKFSGVVRIQLAHMPLVAAFCQLMREL